jgi:hypothetical protein
LYHTIAPDQSSTDGQRMTARRARLRTHRGVRPAPVERRTRTSEPAPRAALDPAGLILELEMAALIKRAASTLRRHPDGRPRSFWRRLLGKLRAPRQGSP